VTTKGPTFGKARIYVDGVLVATIDLYAAPTHRQKLVWQRTWATVGTHTVRIYVIGTSGRPSVDIDGFGLLAAP